MISGQQQINIGLPNEPLNSDSLYTAFNKIQDNFDAVFSCASPFTNFVGGEGVTTSANPTTGTVTITNSGVTNIIAGTNITVSSANGNVTISSTGGGNGGGGTVTSVGLEPASTSRLVVTNSPIVSSGSIGIDLALSGAVAGAYSNPNVTVDPYGRITTITNGPTVGTVTSVGLVAGPGMSVAGGPVTSFGNMTVTNTGVIRLTAGSGINLSGANGNVTVSMSGSVGTVTSVGIYSTSLTVSGSPIVNSGNIRIELPTNPSTTGTFTAGNLETNGTLIVTGNANVGNIGGTNGVFTGNVDALNVNAFNIAGTLTTNAQPNITSVGTLTSLGVSGNITSGNASLGNAVTANFFIGSGANLFAIQAANVVGTVANAANSIRVATTLQTTGIYYLPFISATTNANYGLNSNTAFSANIANGSLAATTFVGGLSGAATTAGTVTTNAQPNITSVGTLTSLAVTGNIASGNLATGGSLSVAGNANVNNLGSSGVLIATGNITGGNLTTSGRLSVTGNANVGNIGAASGVFTDAISGGTTLNITGNANVGNIGATAGVFTGAISGGTTLNITGNANVGNLGTGGSITATGNVSGSNLVASSYYIRSINASVTAAGTGQATATPLTKEINVVSTVASGSGVLLPTAIAGMVLIINNTSANTLNVYPATNAAINGGSANAAYTQISGASLQYYATSSTQWYTVGASYA